jgi:hypothetical protein
MPKAPYFDDADIFLADDVDPDDPRTASVLAAFLALTPADRLRDSRHVFAYYRDVHETVGGEDWLDAEMGVPASPEDIWRFVEPRVLGVWQAHADDADPNDYVWIEGDCGWEDEHGLLLVWRRGETLNKVGGFEWPSHQRTRL